MKRVFYSLHAPREKVLTRNYWELLQVDPEHRIEFTNKYFYKDIILKAHNKAKQARKLLGLHRTGWKLYETVDLESVDEVVIYRTVKIISVATEVQPYHDSSVVETALYSPIASHFDGVGLPVSEPLKTDYDAFGYDEFGFSDNIDQGLSAVDREDINLIDRVCKAVDKRVRNRIKGIKVYDEWNLLGKAQCSMGAHSFTTRHCTQGVYKDGLCYYHWIQTQDKRSGCNPAIPDESLHTIKKPYIPSIDVKAIEAKMKQYYEASKLITPAAETPKKPRCKHLLRKDECSICLGRPSIKSDSIDGLPKEVDSFMIFRWQ